MDASVSFARLGSFGSVEPSSPGPCLNHASLWCFQSGYLLFLLSSKLDQNLPLKCSHANFTLEVEPFPVLSSNIQEMWLPIWTEKVSISSCKVLYSSPECYIFSWVKSTNSLLTFLFSRCVKTEWWAVVMASSVDQLVLKAYWYKGPGWQGWCLWCAREPVSRSTWSEWGWEPEQQSLRFLATGTMMAVLRQEQKVGPILLECVSQLQLFKKNGFVTEIVILYASVFISGNNACSFDKQWAPCWPDH